MASQAYYDWLDAGTPFTLCRPGRDLQGLFRRAGYTVYSYPDDAHQQADPPQDHTPYSAAGWPLPSARWVGHAIDIMPKAGLMPLDQVAYRIMDAKNDEVSGPQPIKYMNWTDASGACWHDSWQPEWARRASTDRGHIHISFRSDMDDSDIVSRSGWNPLTGGAVTTLDSQNADFQALIWRMHALLNNLAEVAGGPLKGEDNGLHAILSTINANIGSVGTKVSLLPTTEAGIASALVAALTAHPEVVDALATAVAARVGMIPTANEIARAVGELAWHGRTEG